METWPFRRVFRVVSALHSPGEVSSLPSPQAALLTPLLGAGLVDTMHSNALRVASHDLGVQEPGVQPTLSRCSMLGIESILHSEAIQYAVTS